MCADMGLLGNRSACSRQAPSEAARPNVIVVFPDDRGHGDMSAHGNPILQTPSMARLHDESVRLTDFQGAPVCTPTRSELITGL